MDPIDPDRLNSFGEAAKLVPSCRGGPTPVKTLHRWRLQGRFAAICRNSGGLRFWFVRGSEVLRLLEGDAPVIGARTPRQLQRASERADKRLRELGVIP